MFPSCKPAQRLFQFVGHVRANENSLAIGHLFSMSPCQKRSNYSASSDYFENAPRYREHESGPKTPTTVRGMKGHAIESKSVSRILYSDPRFEISNLRSQI